MNKFKILYIGAAAITFLGQSPVMADITASVGVEENYNDNIYTLETNKVDSWITVIRPEAKFVSDQGASTYEITLDAASGTYSSSTHSSDDYTDYSVIGKADWQFDAHNQLDLSLGHIYGHDDRGTGRTDVAAKSTATAATVIAANQTTPDEWGLNSAEAKYELGAKESIARLTLQATQDNLNYTNNTPQTDTLDKTVSEVRAIGHFKVAPLTSILVEARSKGINYNVDQPVTRDSSETRYFVGAEWEATAKTTGSIRLGYQEKDPSSATLANYNSTAWEADVIWQPRSYSSMRVVAANEVEDTNSTAFVKSSLFAVSWRHDWSKALSTDVFAQRERQAYIDSVSRVDDVDSFGFSTEYQVQQSLTLSAGYRYVNRGSSAVGLDYDQNIVTVGAKALLL